MSCISRVLRTFPENKPYVELVPGNLYMFKYNEGVQPDSESITLLAGTNFLVVVHVGDSNCQDTIGDTCWLQNNKMTLKHFEQTFQSQLFDFHGTVTLGQP